jgi:hypothetical protein
LYLVGVVEGVVHEASDERRFADRLFAEKDQLELSKRIVERISGRCHLSIGSDLVWIYFFYRLFIASWSF